MPLDYEKMKSRLKAKVASEKKSGAAEPDADEAGGPPDADADDSGMSPGKMALKAIKAGDASALEEAIKRCVEGGY